MSTEFNELLPVTHGDKAQVWIVGTREQVTHLMNEFYVKKIPATLAVSAKQHALISRRSFLPRLPAAST